MLKRITFTGALLGAFFIVAPALGQVWPYPSAVGDFDLAGNRAYINGAVKSIDKVGFKVGRSTTSWVVTKAGVRVVVPPYTLRRSDRGVLITDRQDRVTLSLVPLRLNFARAVGTIVVKFCSYNDVVGMTALSFHEVEYNDLRRISINGNPFTMHYGATTMVYDGVGGYQGFDPLRPYVRGCHTFVLAMNAPGTRVAVAMDGSDVRTHPNAHTYPAALKFLVLGDSYGTGGPHCKCYIERIILMKRIASDAEVKALSIRQKTSAVDGANPSAVF